MKYSESLIPWKKASISKNKNNTSLAYISNIQKTDKSNYVSSATRDPDFDYYLTDFHQIITKSGNEKDKQAIDVLLNKHKKGELESEDIATIQNICSNNYKYLFNSSPESCPNNVITTLILGAFLIGGAITLRISYSIANNSTLLIFIAIINIIASAYTFLNWPSQVSRSIELWLQENHVPSSLANKLNKKAKKSMWIIASSLLSLLVIGLCASFFFSVHELVTDIVSITVLGVSILNDSIITLLVVLFKHTIYYDGQK